MQMSGVAPDEKGKSCCTNADSKTACCQSDPANVSSCCSPGEASWKKGKTLISVVIIMAAVAVGAHSFLSGNSAQSYTTVPAKSFSAGLMGIPIVTPGTPKSQNKPEEISLDRVLDSLQSLDVLAADKDVVFLILSGDMQANSLAIPKQVRAVAINLANSGQRIAVFTVKSGAPDYDRLVRHFSVNTFPCVVILGRQGSASAVAQDISEARLYNAFVLASQSASCCPTAGNSSCCSPQSNAASCCPK
jgi:hypothetical protein